MIAMEVRQRQVRGGKLSAKERLVHFTVPCTKMFIALGEMKRNTMNTDCT